jgi:hypothetical protein
MNNPFNDYDEYASDVIDDACRFLVRCKAFTRAEVDNLLPSRVWDEAIERGWQAPEKL